MAWHVCGIQHGCVVSDVGLQVYNTLTRTPSYELSDWLESRSISPYMCGCLVLIWTTCWSKGEAIWLAEVTGDISLHCLVLIWATCHACWSKGEAVGCTHSHLFRFEVGGDLILPLTFQSDSLMFHRACRGVNGIVYIPFCTGGGLILHVIKIKNIKALWETKIHASVTGCVYYN